MNLAATISDATANYEALLLARIAELERLGALTEPGTSDRNIANIRLIDARAALITWKRRDEE